MGHIADAIRSLHASLPDGVELVAVSKFHPVEALQEAYDAGQRIFGESRVQELLPKMAQMPSDVRWHFIGHLQTNKVRQLLGNPGNVGGVAHGDQQKNAAPQESGNRIALIESVDSERLLKLIDRESEHLGIVTKVLMQVHVAAEATKTGFSPEELLGYFRDRRFETLKATHICGIMGMATNTDDRTRVRADFEAIAALGRQIREIAPDLRGFDTVSMGMSDDYPLAIECGSNLVRIGTAIFGHRDY